MFVAGDTRANMSPWLASLHSLWLREHNRVARALAALNTGWSNDKLYHEARRIVVAELQHVTYRHWLPAVLGELCFSQMWTVVWMCFIHIGWHLI